MNTIIKEKWVQALTDGSYEQSNQAQLKDGDTYCCLGVLCDLYIKETGKGKWGCGLDPDGFINSEGNEESGYLPIEVMKWAGLVKQDPEVNTASGIGHQLSTLNDSTTIGFVGIAKLIKEQL